MKSQIRKSGHVQLLSHAASGEGKARGFTLIELVVLASVLLLLGAASLPILARSNSRSIRCQNNLRQLTAAWAMYAADKSDRVVNNFGVSETEATIAANMYANWADNTLSWGAGSSIIDRSNTNLTWVASGLLGPYLGGVTSVYRCPSDTYLSGVQQSAGFAMRVRSFSMNSVFGRFSSGNDSTANGQNWAFPQYAQYLKSTSVPRPARTWLFIEEHPDSINDGYFVNNPAAQSWQDIPASFHNGGCSIAFADGHTELKRWQSPTSWYRVQFSYPFVRTFDPLGRADFAWYLARTGYIIAQTGQPMFGY